MLEYFHAFFIKRLKQIINESDKHQLGALAKEPTSQPAPPLESLQVIKMAWRRAPEINQIIKICIQII